MGWSEVPQRKDPSRKALSDACVSRVQVGMVKNYLLVFQDSSGVKNVTTKLA